MKKLRMIVTSVIVLAIVGSAFAFNAKKVARFCYAASTGATCFTSASANLKVTSVNNGDVNYFYYTNWDGSVTGCTSHTCTVQAGFLTN